MHASRRGTEDRAVAEVPVEVLLKMTEVKPHEDLIEEGALVEYDDNKGNATW